MSREIVDKLYRPLEVGDYVATARNSYQTIGQIVKITPKRVRVQTVGRRRNWTMYPVENQLIKLNSDDLTFYLLRASQ